MTTTPTSQVGTSRPMVGEVGEVCARTLRDAWSRISCDVALQVHVDPTAHPLLDARVVAAITAELHVAADRARGAVHVVVAGDDTVQVHDDGDGPAPRPGVLTTTARQALRTIGADLVIGRSELLGGTCTTIVRPGRTPPDD